MSRHGNPFPAPSSHRLAFAAVAMVLLTPSAALAVCGCTSLTLLHAGGSQSLCSNHMLNFSECQRGNGGQGTVCPASTYVYSCPVGANSPNLAKREQKTGFVADATLTGTATECQSGQALQLSITSNKSVSKPKVLKTPARGDVQIGTFTATINNDGRTLYPDVGTMTPAPNPRPLYGADSYTDPAAADLLIQETATGLRWWDNTDQSKDDANETATWNYRFFSFVRGSTPATSCACVFDVTVDWTKQAPATSFRKVDVMSTSCKF